MSVTDLIKSSPAAMGLLHETRRRRGRLETSRLEGRGGLEGDLIAAIRRALADRPDPEVRQWFERIEAKRAELATLTGMVQFPEIDGKAEPSRTIGTMTASSKPSRWCQLLFELIRAAKPAQALELGACVGISAAYQSAAMELVGTGRLTSLEGAPALARRSAETQLELGLDRADFRVGLFTDTLPAVLDELGTVDWAFIDGHHQEKPTLEYTELILAHTRPGSVVVYDDLAYVNSPGVTRAWRQLQADPRFGLVIDLRTVGVCVVGGHHEYVRISFG